MGLELRARHACPGSGPTREVFSRPTQRIFRAQGRGFRYGDIDTEKLAF